MTRVTSDRVRWHRTVCRGEARRRDGSIAAATPHRRASPLPPHARMPADPARDRQRRRGATGGRAWLHRRPMRAWPASPVTACGCMGPREPCRRTRECRPIPRVTGGGSGWRWNAWFADWRISTHSLGDSGRPGREDLPTHIISNAGMGSPTASRASTISLVTSRILVRALS